MMIQGRACASERLNPSRESSASSILWVLALSVIAMVTACRSEGRGESDDLDTGSTDASVEHLDPDASSQDTPDSQGSPDGQEDDASARDASLIDAFLADGGGDDAGPSDVDPGDARPQDSGEDGSILDYEVVIVGAGTGGVSAAIQAARMGVRVALLEETTWVGGQATAAGVSSMDISIAHESSYGLYGELIGLVRAHYSTLGKSISTCYWSSASECFEPSVGRRALMDLISAADTEGVLDFFPSTRVESVERDLSTNRVTGVVTTGGLRLSANVVVDATEYGDLLPLAGVRYRVGNSTSDAPNLDACMQDITYVAITKKYPAGLPVGFALPEPPGYDEARVQFGNVIAHDGTPWIASPHAYPYDFVTHAAYRGLPDSSGPGSPTAANRDSASGLTKSGVNWANDHPATNLGAVTGPNATLSVRFLEDRTYRQQAICAARLKTLQFVHYIQTDLAEPQWSMADDEGFSTDDPCPSIPDELRAMERLLPPIPYVRESRRMIGIFTLTARHMIPAPVWPPRSATLFPSTVAVGAYGNDLHNCHVDADLEADLETAADISGGRVFQIPLEAFIPEVVDGFLPAEKNLSQSRLANGATRLQPTTMATGQAVGALAALAVLRGVEPREVPVVVLQDALVRAGARLSLYRFTDVLRGHPGWAAVELVSARGLMVGVDPETFRPDDAATRAQGAIVLARLLELDTSTPPASPSFEDTPMSHFAYAAIEAMRTAGLTAGCSADPPRFCPEAPLDRASLAVFLARGLALDVNHPPVVATFTDVPSDHWAFAAVEAVERQGLIPNCASTGLFCPSEAVRRQVLAETARSVLRFVVDAGRPP